MLKVKVNNKFPFEIDPQDDFTVKCNYFVELSRVANVLDTGKGTSVVVSY